MPATITLYNSMKEYIADGTIDLDTDTFKVALVTSTYTPNFTTHTVYADLTNELTTANGYTSGGATLGSVTWNRSGGTVTFDAADTTWTASGGSITARRAILYKDTTTANGIVRPLIAAILMDDTPADVTATAGNTLTLQWNASGIFTLS
jgi:hypothetical protein